MAFFNKLLVFGLFHLLVVQAPDRPSRRDIIKRPDPNHGSAIPQAKYAKVEKPKVDKDLGQGGTYESVQPVASKKGTIESDHAPHYSILDYLDLDKLKAPAAVPTNIRAVVEERKRLLDELGKTDYPKNEERLKTLKTSIAELNKHIAVKKWKKSLGKQYTFNVKEITKLWKEIKTSGTKSIPGGDPSLELNVAQNQQKIDELMKQNSELRHEAEKPFRTPENQAKLAELEGKFNKLEKVNKELSKDLDRHNRNIHNAMGVLSIPYDKHRKFPTTGSAGLGKEITALTNADATTAEAKMKDFDQKWASHMKEGIKNDYFDDIVDDNLAKKSSDGSFPLGSDDEKIYYKRVWEANIDSIIDQAQRLKKWKNGPPPTLQQLKSDYMNRLHHAYAKKFVSTSIYYIKTPEKGYGRLVSLYISEYKTYLNADFDSYKPGLLNLLNANKDFGWLGAEDIKKIDNEFELSKNSASKSNEWNDVERLIKVKRENSNNPLIPARSTNVKPPIACSSSSSTRRRRSVVADGCIFFTKRHQDNDIDAEKQTRKSHLDLSESDGLHRPEFKLPSDADTVSIDSRRLNNYISKLDDADMASMKIKESVVEYASRNSDKLTGSPEDIAKSKALIKQEILDANFQQNALAGKALRNAGDIPAKALTKYQKVKISASKVANKVAKFASGSSKVSGSYGKVMLAKGFVTALRHGDYESLMLMGGRIGLEFGLQAVTKLGQRIAKKATTKFMTKFGSEVLGEMAAPVGAIADIGMNIYSIVKAVKRLNNPNATRFDQNDAIADIVADSIDIAVTATAAVLSLVLPPLAPLFAAVAFIVNIFATIFVAFYKAANHVDRLNDEIPLLDYERTTEYWRYVGGRNTSGYIQELIDTKKANNMVVNMTVQFLINNPYFIGRVFPSQTMYDPAAECALEKRDCSKFRGTVCSDWEHLGYCDGRGGICQRGDFIGQTCFPFHETFYKIEYCCWCGPDPDPVWGYNILDNYVDFRFEQDVFLQRAAPDHKVPSIQKYLCKPSSLEDEGDRVSIRHRTSAYLCKGTIGVIRRNQSGKFMLYDLGTGNDHVRLKRLEKVDNLFIVKDGHKNFYGNGGDDTFTFDGPCNTMTGVFNGMGRRDQGNSLVLGQNCSRGLTIVVDLNEDKITFGSDSNTAEIYHIQQVIGRKDETELVNTDSNTKTVAGGGGKNMYSPDVITISWCYGRLNMIVSVEGSTILEATDFYNGSVSTFLSGRFAFEARIPRQFEGTLLFIFESDVGPLTSAQVDNSAAEISLDFINGGNSKFKFYGSPPTQNSANTCEAPNPAGSQISIFLRETSHFRRQLSYSLDQGRMQCVYYLEREGGGGFIHGYDFMDNVFHLKSGSWYAHGGGRNNHYSLVDSEFSGVIDGRSGQNTLTFGDGISESLEINLNSEVIRGRNTIQIRNVQTVVGRDEFVERVRAACNTKFLDMGGAALDTVEIPILSCPIDLTIAVKGRTSIRDQSQNGSVTIQGGYDGMSGCSKSPQPLQLSLDGGMMTILHLNFPMHKLIHASATSLNIDGGHQVVLTGRFPNVYFGEDSNLKSTLIVEDGRILAFHELNILLTAGNAEKLRKGSNSIPNVFKLVEGSNWKVSGGSHDDTFSLVGNSFHGEIDGGSGKNSLFIGDDIGGDVSLLDGAIWIQGSKSVSYQNIAEFHGRSGKPDRITVDCHTQFVGVNGGMEAQNYDMVTIPKMECDPDPKMNIVCSSFTQVSSFAERGKFDIYVQLDPSHNLKFQSNVVVTNATVFNFPIQYPAHKLISYQLEIDDTEEEASTNINIRLLLKMSENDNFVQFHHKFHNRGYEAQLQNVNMMFVDEEFKSIGNILINKDMNELNILHVLQDSGSESSQDKMRRGATGAKNIFRLHSGNWEAYGGTLDDTFILKGDNFQGKIHGLGGVNALILAESINTSYVTINLLEKTLTMNNGSSLISVNGIQTAVGRKSKQDYVICACDTKLVMLEGGESHIAPDVIQIRDSFCHPSMSLVLGEFTQVENNATGGNFTYHVRTDRNFNINYAPLNSTNHNFKFEMPLNQVKNVKLEEEKLIIDFGNKSKTFRLNFHNLPTFQFVEGPELVSELILEEGEIPHSSIIARSPFSGSIIGLNGAFNGITVQTSASIESMMGGDKDDNIFLSQVESVLLINGRGGTNRLQFSEELHPDRWLEVDFPKERVTFLEDSNSFVTVLKGITVFSGREESFERVIVGCDTGSVKFVDEVIIRSNCGYNVRIEMGTGTRVIFEIGQEDDQDERLKLLEEPEVDDDEVQNELEVSAEDFEGEMNAFKKELEQLEPSTFYYHFSIIKNFDIEVDSFTRLARTRHIFYLNFTLSQLSTLRFSLDDSRLIYSIFDQNEMEFSHLVEELEPSAMFYSQPEFMTGEGFLLRISRYGEIIAVVANPQENLELEFIQEDIIPRLTTYASQLGISFMLETGSEFIYCGSPLEIGLLSNRENVTSHLVGFNQTTYEILDLDNDVFIYPQLVGNDSVHNLDLTDITFQIRNRTQLKYVPEVIQVGPNLHIQMTNWTDMFPGKVILTNGTSYNRNMIIMLNSIAMEILPVHHDKDPLPVTDSGVGHRHKRSPGGDIETIWAIKPRPISIPEGHVYLLAAEDLEDGVVVKKETVGDDNSTFDYSKDDKDLIITSINPEGSGNSTSFIIFDYYATSQAESPANDFQNETLAFGKVETVNDIHVMLGKEAVIINSNQPILSDETGEEMEIEFYEDILDREEAKIVKGIPGMPRKFKVSWMRKIGRTAKYRHAAWGVLLGFTVLIGILTWTFCRKKPVTGKYSPHKLQTNRFQVEDGEDVGLVEYRDKSDEDDFEQPKLGPMGTYWFHFCRKRPATGNYSPQKVQTNQLQHENGEGIELLEYHANKIDEDEDLADNSHSHSE